MPERSQLYALAICAHLPLRGENLGIRRFRSEDEFSSALQQAGVTTRERLRIVQALKETGRTLTPFTDEQATILHPIPLTALSESEGMETVRPSGFHLQRIASRPVPYLMLGPNKTLSSSGGVLPVGCVVWLEGAPQHSSGPTSVRAFVEGVGLIQCQVRWLRKMSSLQLID